MTRTSSTRNPVQVRAVQFSSSLVGTYGCGPVQRDCGRVRPTPDFGLWPGTGNRRAENLAGCGFGSMFPTECHALPPTPGTRISHICHKPCNDSDKMFLNSSLTKEHFVEVIHKRLVMPSLSPSSNVRT